MRRKPYPIAAIATALLSAAACSTASPSPDATSPMDESAAAPIPLTACYSSVSSTQSVAIYAEQMGLFAKHGLDVELVLIDSTTQAAAAMIAGDVSVCQFSGAVGVNAIVAGAPMKIVAGLYNTYVYSLMVAPEIEQGADLVGRTLAISQVGSASEFASRVALRELGLDPDRDVSLAAVGGQAERLAAMISGQASGTLVSVPETAKAREMGFHTLLDMSTLNVPYQHTAILARTDWISGDRPTALRFMKAIAEAAWRMKRDREGARSVVARHLLLDMTADRAALDETFDGLIVKYLQSPPYPTLPGIQRVIDEVVAENPKAAGVKAESMIDPSLVEEIERDGFFAELEKGQP